MLSRNSTIIDPQKGKEFSEFLRKNAKSQEFWNDVKKKASASVDKNEIDKLFADSENK